MAFSNYVTNIRSYFKNVTLNAVGANRDFEELLNDRDVMGAISMMDDNTTDVDNAIKEYNPQLHDIMKRPNKYPKGKEPYITCKLPRTRERYINEVELFFLLGKPVNFTKLKGEDEAFELFNKFIRDYHWDSRMRQCKRLAGAETECAKLYRTYKESRADGSAEFKCDLVVLARSKGYTLRPMFDQYGNMIAFAYGYKLKDNKGTVWHWDIQTKDKLYFCKKEMIGWQVEKYENPTGKINVIYYKQPKAWDGVEPRIKREEELDSKIGDTNNYYADPIALATADVVESMVDPHAPAKLLQATGSNSRFEYVNPPQSSELRAQEKKDLHDSILFDTQTPDFDISKMSGYGVLTGVAVRNSFVLAYMKRDNRKEIYGELVEREVNLIKAILKEMYPLKSAMIDELEIEVEFADPFGEDQKQMWQALSQLYTAGLVSLETAIDMLNLTNAPQEEIDRIKMAKMEQMMAQLELQAEQAQESGIGQNAAQVDEDGNRVLTAAEHRALAEEAEIEEEDEKGNKTVHKLERLMPNGRPVRYKKKPKGTNEGTPITA